MEKRNCLYCGKAIGEDKKEGTKFCDYVCRYKDRNKKRLERENGQRSSVGLENKTTPPPEQPAEKPLSVQLRGIVEEPKPHVITKTTKVLNTRYAVKMMEKQKLESEMKHVTEALQSYENKIKQTEKDFGWLLYPTLAITGAAIGDHIQKTNAPLPRKSYKRRSANGKYALVHPKSSKNFNAGMVIGGALGIVGAAIFASETRIERQQKQAEINGYRQKIKELATQKARLKAQFEWAVWMVSMTPQFVTKTIQETVLLPAQVKVPEVENTGISAPVPQLAAVQREPSEVPVSSGKIIPSTQLKDIDYKALDFRGNWLTLFGQPSTNFHMVIHGMPGEGKSTFSLLFAKYLAENNGEVLYISGEEGHSKTMQDKVTDNHIASNHLAVADLRNYAEIIQEVQPDKYNFIVFDSLDNLRIDADKMKQIRQLYKDSALITICQSTKDGKMRGSNEIAHDADITVEVKNGIATTTKNRFKEKGMTYDIFNKSNTGGGLRALRGTI